MSRRVLLITGVVIAILAIGAYGAYRATQEPVVPQRTVAFDNLYGNVPRVPVYVTVDGGQEQALTATCDAKTCSFKIPLANARHEVAIAVEFGGRRSEPTRVTLDTSNLR